MGICPPCGGTMKLVYAYITYTLMMMVYSAINVPYASLLGVMSPNPAERNTLATYRMMFAYIGSFIALLLFTPMVKSFGGDRPSDVTVGWMTAPQFGWFATVAVIAIMCTLLFFTTVLGGYCLEQALPHLCSIPFAMEQQSTISSISLTRLPLATSTSLVFRSYLADSTLL